MTLYRPLFAAGGMNEMGIGDDQINQAVNLVNDQSAKNQQNIDLLIKEVPRFKVDHGKEAKKGNYRRKNSQ